MKETKGAKRLFNRVNKMLNRVDGLVASLEQKEKEITEIKAREGRTEAELERDAENLVTIQELIDAVTKLQETPDSSKLEQIAEVGVVGPYHGLDVNVFVFFISIRSQSYEYFYL